MQSTEIWKPVVGFESIYEVSSEGRVRSVSRYNAKGQWLEGKFLAINANKVTGYPTVKFWRDGKSINRTVHTVMLEAFEGPRPPKHEARHLNGVRDDNRVENLRWGTARENARDKILHGTEPKVAKALCKLGHPLVLWNLVPSKLKAGSRDCLACNLAKNYSRYHGVTDERAIESEADGRFKVLASEALLDQVYRPDEFGAGAAV